MYALGSLDLGGATQQPQLTVEERIAVILALRERVMQSRDLLYASPSIRHLVEDEIPALVAMVREERRF